MGLWAGPSSTPFGNTNASIALTPMTLCSADISTTLNCYSIKRNRELLGHQHHALPFAATTSRWKLKASLGFSSCEAF